MAERLLNADLHGLYMAAELVELFWKEPSTRLHAEIRRATERYGLDPLARRRLDWRIREPVAEPEEPTKPAATGTAGQARRPRDGADPRSILRLMQGKKT